MLMPTFLKPSANRLRPWLHDLLPAAGAMGMRLLRAVALSCGFFMCVGVQAADNTIYAVAGTTIYELNPASGAVVSTGTLSFSTNAAGRDPLTGRVYYLETASPFRVAYFDPLTSFNTILPGQLGFSTNRAAVDASGVLWVMDPANNNLFTVNPTSGLPTFQGTVSGIPTGQGGDIAFSPSGQLYVVANTVLYAITGFTATSINTSAPGAVPGLAFVDGGDPIVAVTTNLYRMSLSGNTTTLVGATGVAISDLAAYSKFADVAISKTAGSVIFTRGANATYNLAVRNNGPQSASGPFTVTDTLPSGLTFVSGIGSGWACTAVGQAITCTNGTSTSQLANGASLANIVLTVAVAAGAPNSVTNTALVSSTTLDSNGANNTSTVITSVGTPTISKLFNPTVVATGSPSTLTLTITNSTATALTGVAFDDPFPANLVIASTPNLTNTCAGTITGGAAGNTSVGLTNGALAANASCVITVAVSSAVVGTYANTAAGVSTTQTGAAGAPSNTAVLETARPVVIKSFSPTSIGPGTKSTLTITLSNAANVALTSAAFTDTFPTTPAAMTVATPLTTTNTCGGTLQNNAGGVLAAGAAGIRLVAGTIPAASSCVITVEVTASTAGGYTNTIAAGAVTTANGGSNAAAASAILAIPRPGIAKFFSPSAISTNSPSTLTITLTNSSSTAYTGAAFTDTYPAGVTNTATPGVTNTCAGTVTAVANTTTLVLTGGTIPANGNCQITVKVTSASAGSYTNTIAAGGLTTTNGGSNAALTNAILVAALASDLQLTKTHSGNFTVGVNAVYTLTVNNAGSAASTGTITVTDTLPAGLAFVSAAGTGWTCGASGQTVTCTSTTAIAIGASSPNPITLTASVAAAAAPSVINTATVSGGGETNNANNTATDTATVFANPVVAKSFNPVTIGTGQSSLITLTLTNPNASPITGVAFTDTYPANLLNTAIPGAATTCGGIVTAAANGGNVALTGATIPANGSCTVSVNVTSSVAGSYTNTLAIGALTTGNAGSNSAIASAVLQVLARPVINKSFSPSSMAPGATSVLTLTLTNSNATVLTGAAFTDTYPSGLTNTATPAAATTCAGGTVTVAPSGTTLALSGASIPASGSCTVTVNVTAAAAGNYVNSIPIGGLTTANAGANSTAANATLAVLNAVTATKAFGPATIGVNGVSVLTITLTNGNATAVTGAAFTDAYPGGLINTASASGATTCTGGTVTATNGGSSVALASGTVPANGACTVSVNVTSASTGVYNNSTGPVTTTNAGTAAAGSATLTVAAPDLRLTKAHSGNFTVGVQGVYSLVVNNTLGSVPTSALITVVDTLPAGLGYVSAGSGGTGWTCAAAGQVVTCTSNTVIAAGAASANPITINVSVAAVAVPSVTNSATVSGGGEQATQAGNNAAFDFTVVVVAVKNSFQPDGAQTALPGTTVFYPHTFNVSLTGTLVFSTSNVPTPAAGGWSNVIYRDSNCNGVLDGVEGTAPLAGSISINPGDTVCIVIKEFVPASAPYNANDLITVTATFTPVSGPVVTYIRTDTTTVGNPGGAGLSLSKTVRNVTTSGSAGTANAARPGETLEYTVAYSNNSADPLATITIHDATPAFTAFVSASCGAPLPANVTACNVTTQPAGGATGGIAWTLTGSLASTQSGTITFRVTVQ